MLERTRYIKDVDGTKFGVLTFLYENGKFGAGMSVCKLDEDKFDRVAGKEIAKERAIANLKASPVLLKDLVKVRSFRDLAKITSCSIPSNMHISKDCENMDSRADTIYRMATALGTYHELFGDLLYSLALAKVRAEA